MRRLKQVSLSLQHVTYLPQELLPGILYVSLEYTVAGHLCACGCGNKVIVPLNRASWTFSEHRGLPTLYPSIGNWQLSCRSHYFITDGKIVWAPQWTDTQIAMGREAEQFRLKMYYADLHRENNLWRRLYKKIMQFWKG